MFIRIGLFIRNEFLHMNRQRWISQVITIKMGLITHKHTSNPHIESKNSYRAQLTHIATGHTTQKESFYTSHHRLIDLSPTLTVLHHKSHKFYHNAPQQFYSLSSKPQ